MKGACGRARLPRTFAFKSIRLEGTDWRLLLLVGREANPHTWNDLAALDDTLWLGVVTRTDYEAALRAKCAAGRGDMALPHDAAVSVGCKRSWLGPYVRWWRFAEITTLQWWNDLVASTVTVS